MLDWDDNAHTIHTSSLHYFEGDPSLRMGRTVFPLGPKAVTDPQVLWPTFQPVSAPPMCVLCLRKTTHSGRMGCIVGDVDSLLHVALL